MYITNVVELVEALKLRLRDYLVIQLGDEAGNKRFPCFVHNDHDPSMYYNPKNGGATVHCFSCGASHDIFSACAFLESLPVSGPSWITQTLPHLAEKLGIEVKLGEASPADQERAKQYKMAGDIATILESAWDAAKPYCEHRGWSNELLTIGTIELEVLKSELIARGWSHEQLQTSAYFANDRRYFGLDKVTFVINDYRGRPIGFISRSTDPENEGPKYLITPETVIHQKRKTLFGIDTAIKEGKQHGVYVVEGQGDVAALHAAGVTNVVAAGGTAFTADHFASLKMVGIRQLYFCFDWDDAGQAGIMKVLREELKNSPGISCWVVGAPTPICKDPGEYIETRTGEEFKQLPKTGAFEWIIAQLGQTLGPEVLCAELTPIIAAEPTAVRREMLIKTLSDMTGFSFHSVMTDVNNLRDSKFEERRDRLSAVAERFQSEVQTDPDEIQSLIAQMESDIGHIESEYKRDTIGINYQRSRYDALQEQRKKSHETGVGTEFLMSRFTMFAQALNGGMPWSEGVLIYFGGRANSGKTAVMIAIGLDIAMTDPEAIVVMHFTDDNYSQVEPRIKANILAMLRDEHEKQLSIGKIANPWKYIENKEEWELYSRADERFKQLLDSERLIIIDAEDGSTVSTLERQLKYVRQRHPEKKLLVVADNTHNYMDFLHLDNTTRMTRICQYQKMLTGKYRCCMAATVEYRKNSSSDTSKLRLPVDDDIADGRALMYRPNMITHVYNDLNDRREEAEILWHKPGQHTGLPRLMLVISKNKITKFKDKLMLDLDPETVTLQQYSADDARYETELVREAREKGQVRYDNGEMIVEAEFDD